MSAIDRSGWRTVRLGDIAEVVTGTTPSTTEPRYWGGHVPFVTPSDLTGHVFTGQTARTLSDDGAAVARVVPAHSTLVTCIGTVGRVALTTVPCTTNQQINAVIPGPEVDATFLSYALATQARVIERLAGVTAVPIVNKSQLKDLRLRIPNLDHQVRIAQLLQRASEVLQQVDSLIAAKREFQRGLMQELLTGRRRFPEFQHDPRPTVALREVTIINPDTLPESTDDYFRFHYIDISSVSDGRVTIPVSAIAFRDAPSRARRIVRQYDVLFSTVRPYLKGFAIVEDDRRDLVCSTGFAVLRAATKADAQYLLEVLFSDVVGRQVHARLVGSSFPALNSDDVANIRIPWPSAPERAKISHVLGAIRREIHLLEEMRARFETAKRGLMQKLLTGELTVPVSSEPEPVHA